MSNSNHDDTVKPPGVQKIALSLLLLALFAPVVLAVGSAAFRPAWLTTTVAGAPLSVLWVLGSILIFIVLTWTFARMTFVQAGEGAER